MSLADITLEDVQQILLAAPGNKIAETWPMYPLDAPGMPQPGVDFRAQASALAGDDKERYGLILAWLYLRCLYGPMDIPVVYKGTTAVLRTIPGHLWNSDPSGPTNPAIDANDRRPRVMIVGHEPAKDEIKAGRNLVGAAGVLLRDTLEAAGINEEEMGRWYVANLIRWRHSNNNSASPPTAWIKDCLPLLHQELRLFRPDYILCLGAASTKVLCGSSLDGMSGRYVDLKIPVHDRDEPEEYHTAKVMAVVHPAAVLRTTERQPQFEMGITNFANLIHDKEQQSTTDNVVLWYVSKERELKQIVDTILGKPGIKPIAIDAEWEGQQSPADAGAYLRTIQISPHPDVGIVLALRDEEGNQLFAPSVEAAVVQLNRLIDDKETQFIGHYASADIPWLEHEGVRIKQKYKPPNTFEEFRGGTYAGGFDVSLGVHAHNETSDFGLEMLAVRYCGAPRWDIPLSKYKDDFCKKNKIEKSELLGYGKFDWKVLFPYGAFDAIFTRRLRDVVVKPSGLLDKDMYGLDNWYPCFLAMRAYPAFIDMHMNGVNIDRQRVDDLTDLYMEVQADTIQKLKEEIKWPAFNIRSSQMCQEFLFGDKYASKRDPITGQRMPVRPRDALTLGMTPVKTTGKRAIPWERVVANGEEHLHSPSTDKETCGILAMANKMAGKLRNCRLIDQVLKSVLSVPAMEDNKLVLTAQGNRLYDGGLASYLCYDSRVRSTFSLTLDSGRASSARPPLQNLSARREKEYRDICGERYRWPIRSIITGSQLADGRRTLLVEADFTGAELLILAVQAQDKKMIEHCLRGQLPETDPNYYDIHSNVCVVAFKLDCSPTKSGLVSIGKKDLRTAAKATIFARNYGGGAETITRRIKEEATQVTVDEVQAMLDAIDAIYPDTKRYQEECFARVLNPGWLASCFGARRRFIPSEDQMVMREMGRIAANFPMQGGVAGAMNIGLYNLLTHPRKEAIGYKIILQIHDAVLLEVPTEHVAEVYDVILPECLETVTFKSCNLDGIAYPNSIDYHFATDKKVCYRWGVQLKHSDCDEFGIEHRFGVAN